MHDSALPQLVDYHCHLDLYPDCGKEFEAASRHGIITLAVTTTPRAWARNKELAQGRQSVRVALGLHPQLVAERADEIELFEELLPCAAFVGEVGLDAGPRFYRGYAAQRRVFERILKACAEAGNKVLSVHSARAVRDVLDLIEKHLSPDKGRVVLHWFCGTKSEAHRAVELGCYFSVNAQMLGNDTRREVVSRLPLNRILTETDGPFTMMQDRPSRPSDVGIAIRLLATTVGAQVDQVARRLVENVDDLESLSR